MRQLLLSLLMLGFLTACAKDGSEIDATREEIAIEFLNGMYTGNPAVVDTLAAPDIVVSYPIFNEVFGTPSILGREAVRDFVVRFGKRWVDAEVTVHEVATDGDIVVVVWGFRARAANPEKADSSSLSERKWGGITLYRFDSEDRIILELGEESAPGPAARVPNAFTTP